MPWGCRGGAPCSGVQEGRILVAQSAACQNGADAGAPRCRASAACGPGEQQRAGLGGQQVPGGGSGMGSVARGWRTSLASHASSHESAASCPPARLPALPV